MYSVKDRKKDKEVLLEWSELDLIDFVNAMIGFCESRGKVMSFAYSTEHVIFKLGCLWNWEYGNSGSGHFGEKIHYEQGYDITIKRSEVKSITLIRSDFLKILYHDGDQYNIRMGAEGAISFIWTLAFGGR
jgi:hypothetical protein